MSRRVKTTRRLRVRLDFVIELPVEVASAPIGGSVPANEWAHRITEAAARAVCELLPENVKGDGGVPAGARVQIGLDYRRPKTSGGGA